MPPADLDPQTREAWFEQVAEHVGEFVRTDYEVVLADDGAQRAPLAAALAAFGLEPPPAYAAGRAVA